MQASETDAALWLEAVSGTERAFAVLYDRHRERVFRKAYSCVRSVPDSEDVVALVFLEAWRSRKKVRIVDGSLLPWLMVVTGNVVRNSERSSRRYMRLVATLPRAECEPDHTDETDERLDAERRSIGVRAALRKLNAADQTILDLCLVEELPHQAVAQALDVPVGSVKSRLSRARNRLRIHLGNDHELTRLSQAEGEA